MTNASRPYWTTSVSDIAPEDVYVRGYPLRSIIGQLPFSAVTALLIKGKMPSPGEAKVMDSILCSILDYGLQKSGTIAARCVVSVNPQMAAGLAAAVLAAGEFALSPEDAGRFIQSHFETWQSSGLPLEVFTQQMVADLCREKKRIPGFGHPVFRNVDPRAQTLKDIAVENGVWGEIGSFYEAVHRAFKPAVNKPDLVINDVGMIACILAEMKYSPQEMAGLAILSTIPGVIAHISEELASNVRIRVVPDAIVQYDVSRKDLAADMVKAGWKPA